MAATNIPIIVQGNSFNLAIPLQIYVIQDNEMVLQDYTPLPTDDVSIQLKGCRRNYTYTPTVEGNVAKVYLTGNELADNYSIVVSIVKANGERLRSFRTDQFFIVESSDDLTQADIIEGLEDNVIYLQPQYFIAGEDGRGIISVTKTATSGLIDTYTITYTDNTTSTFQVTNGALQPVIVDIEGDVTNAPDEEDLTSVNNGNHDVLKFNDKAYMPTIASGLGRKYLRKNFVNGINKLTQAMVADANTIYHIQYDYDLDGATITLQAGVTLKFDGGSIKNGTIVGNGTQIDATDYDVLFRNATFTGTWNVKHASVCWFGAVRSTTTDKHDIAVAFQSAMSFPCNEVYVPRGLWYVGTTLQMNKFKQLRLEGEASWFNLGQNKTVKDMQARLFCDSNITMLLVDGVGIDDNNGVFGIKGGVFDISLAPASSGYDKAVIEITNTLAGSSFACHGAEIETTITGKFSISQLQDGTAIKASLTGSGYIGGFTTKCNIWQIGNGIKLEGTLTNGQGWITGYTDSSSIRAAKALDIDIYSRCSLNGIYQALAYIAGASNEISLCYLNSPRLEINGSFWDMFASDGGGKRAPKYAVEFGGNCDMFLQTSTALNLQYRGWVKNPDIITFWDTAFELYRKYPDGSLMGYNDLDNFFIDNANISSFSIEAGSDDANDTDYASRVAFTNFDNVFSPYKTYATLPTITYTLAEGEELHEDDFVKMTINFADSFQFVLFGLTHRNGAYESVNVKLYSGSTLTYEEERTPSKKKFINNVYCDRIFFKNVNAFASKIEITLKNPQVNVDEIIDFVGIVKYGKSNYITSAGGDLHKPVSWDGKILIDPQVYASRTALPTPANYRSGSVCIFKDWNNDTVLGVHDGTYWKLVPLRYNNQALFDTSNFGTYNKNTFYFNSATKTMRVFFEKDLKWRDFDGCEAGIARGGDLADKPTTGEVVNNFVYLARDLKKPIFANKFTGLYVEADGATAGVKRNGATADRPASSGIYTGFTYWDTDLGKMIAWNGSAWVNLDGTALS